MTPLSLTETWRQRLAHSLVVLAATGLSVAGWYLPWVSFIIDGKAKQLGPAIIAAYFSTPPGIAPAQTSLSPETIGLVLVLVLFAAALSLISRPAIIRISASQLFQALVSRMLALWCGCVILFNLSLIWIMIFALGFDDGDTSATNFHYDIGAACSIASIVLAGGHRFFARQVDSLITRLRPPPIAHQEHATDGG